MVYEVLNLYASIMVSSSSHAFSHGILTAIYEAVTNIYLVLFGHQTILSMLYIYIN